LGAILDGLRPRWRETVVIAVSDHDMETMADRPPIDLYGPVANAGLDLVAIPEGSGAVVWGDDPTGGTWLDDIDGVAGHNEAWTGARLVWAERGRCFALPPGFDQTVEPGNHGGRYTCDQVAVVGGGHPAADRLAAAIRTRSPAAADWAP